MLETNRMKEKAVIVVCHKLEWLSFSYHINQPQGIRACFSAGIIFTITLRGQSSHFTDEENEVQKVKCLSTISNLANVKARILIQDNLFPKSVSSSQSHTELPSSVSKGMVRMPYVLHMVSYYQQTLTYRIYFCFIILSGNRESRITFFRGHWRYEKLREFSNVILSKSGRAMNREWGADVKWCFPVQYHLF